MRACTATSSARSGLASASEAPSMADDVGELIAVEFGVHRHRDHAGVPDRKQSFEKFWPVGHGDRHTIARAAEECRYRRAPANAPPIPGLRKVLPPKAMAGRSGAARPFFDPAREVHRRRRTLRSGSGLGVNEHRGNEAGLAAPIDPRMVVPRWTMQSPACSSTSPSSISMWIQPEITRR